MGYSKRSDDLRYALRNGGRKRTGNHRVEIVDGLLSPDIELCKPCDLSLRCLASTQISIEQAFRENRPCCRHLNRINFYFYDKCCLTFDRQQRRVTDHNMYGYSVTTSKSIRAYLHALDDTFPYLNLSYDRIDEIIKAFKTNKMTNAKEEGGLLWLDI